MSERITREELFARSDAILRDAERAREEAVGDPTQVSSPPEPSEEAQVAALQAYERFGVALSDSGLFQKVRQVLRAAYAVDFPAGSGPTEERSRLALVEELRLTDSLLESCRETLRLIPECPIHGFCHPHMREWIQRVLRGAATQPADGETP